MEKNINDYIEETAETQSNFAEQRGKKPTRRFKSGPVSCAIWETEIMATNNTTGEKYPRKIHHIALQRSYRDKQTGEWKNSSTLPLDNLPDAIALLQHCYNYIKVKDVTSGQDDFDIAKG